MWSYQHVSQSDLVHYGVLGQKWGVRRYQNKDGSLTPKGQERARKELDKTMSSDGEKFGKYAKKSSVAKSIYKQLAPERKAVRDIEKFERNEYKHFTKNPKKMYNYLNEAYREKEKSIDSNKNLSDSDKKELKNQWRSEVENALSGKPNDIVSDAYRIYSDRRNKGQLQKAYVSSIKAYDKKLSKLVNKTLGDIGNMPVSGERGKLDTTYRDALLLSVFSISYDKESRRRR